MKLYLRLFVIFDVDLKVGRFVSVMEKSSTGRMSPVRGRTMKEYDQVSV